MLKNLSSNQLVLIAIATVLLLMAAFSFYLLQNPSAPLPFAPQPATSSSTPLPPTLTINPSPIALTPTRKTSYTPQAAFITPNLDTPRTAPTISETVAPGTTVSPGATMISETPAPGTTASPGASTITATTLPINTLSSTPTTPSASSTIPPAATGTLSAGEHGVTGRVLQNGTAVANVVVEFADDVAQRQATTNPGGHYWFVTLAPGTNFTLKFNQFDNLGLTPTAEVASLAMIEGTLSTGATVIDLPDFEVSINLNGMLFNLQTPADGITYSAAAISASNPIQFNWSLYNQGGSYKVQLGLNGSDVPVWSSSQLASTSYMWNGTLDDGAHITQGSYWWRVSVTKSLANYILVVCTQQFDIQFNP
jgi:hypothetical protein